MAPKKPATATGPAAPSASTSSSSSSSSASQIDMIAGNIFQHYQKTTPQRTQLIEAYMAFLLVARGLQFAYCVLAGNYVRIVHLLLHNKSSVQGER